MLPDAMEVPTVTEPIGGRYRPLRLLGRGAIGEALLVADTHDGDVERALKWIPLSARRPDAATAAADPILAALSGEFQILSTLDHPHLTRVFDFGHDPVRGGWYLVEEWSSGTPLAVATVTDAADAGTALARLAAQLLDTLAFLHERGIVHGDIQPANVLVEDRAGSPHLRLIDFSGALARWLESRPPTGTPGFIAPEILAGGAASPATDLYSAGALLRSVLPPDGSASAALTDLCTGLCQLDPTLRLRSARDAARILGGDEPAATAAGVVAQAPLFGRDEELADACQHLGLASEAAAALAATRLVVADGPVGIGKSRFLEELETRARLAGIAVVHLRAAAGPGALAAKGALHVIDPLPHPVSPLGRAIRARLATSAADAAPIRIAGSPASEDEARAWRSSLTEELSSRSTVWIDLGPLDEPACESLAAWVTPGADSATSRASLARRSGGNPLLLLELANARAAGHDLPERGRGVTALTDRIRALNAADSACLAALAVLDDAASAIELGFVLGSTPAELHVRLRQLEGRGLVHPAGEDGSRWLPTHGLAAEAALTTAPESERTTWYRRTAEARESGCLRGDPVALARDWLRAREPRRAVATLGDGWQGLARDGRLHLAAPLLVEAVEALVPAALDGAEWLFLARALEQVGEPEAALDCAGRAERAADVTQRSPLDGSSEVALVRATALRALGRVPDAVAALDRVAGASVTAPAIVEMRMRLSTLAGRPLDALAAASASEHDPAAAEALAVQVGYAHLALGQNDAASASFRRALASLDPSLPAARAARALAASGLGVLAMHTGDHAAAVGHFRDALTVSAGASSVRERAAFRLNLAAAMHGLGELLPALSEYAEAAEELRAAGAWRELAHALAVRASLLAFLGDLRAARVLASEACEVLPSGADAQAGIVPWLVAAECAREDGDADDAERAARIVNERAAPRSRERALGQLVLGEVARRRGDGAAALAALGEALTLAASLDARDILARAFLARGRVGARSRTEREADLSLALTTFTEAGERIGRAESALALIALLEDLPEQAARAAELRTLAHREIREQARRVPDRYRPLFLRSRGFDARVLEGADDVAGAAPAAHGAAGGPGASARATRSANRTLLDARLMRVLEINRRLANERDRQRLLERILDSAIELAEAERGFLVVSDGTTVEIPVARNLDRETLGRPGHLISRTIAEGVLARGETFDTPDAMADARLASAGSVHDLRVRSVLCVPCRGNKGVVGALYLDHRFWADAFGPDDRVLIEALADQAAIALENLRLADELKRRNGELENAQRELEATNRELAREAQAERARVAAFEEKLEHAQRENALRYRYDRIVGRSPAMLDALKLVDRVTDTDSTVLVYGESGTGKELIARAIHYNGPRARAPFVSINCGALPETLLEATLFGHRRGAFTGATETRTGLFEEADGGTLFLDEVGDMSPTMQVRLLRALQEGEIRAVGGDRPIKVNVRIVAATHRDLREEVAKGTFRQDLLYRLEVIVLRLPPLRERREDIPLLAEHLLREAAERERKHAPALSRGALELLVTHEWRGNVRELASVLETARILSGGEVIQAGDLAASPAFRMVAPAPGGAGADGARAASASGDFREQVHAFERKVLSDALERADGNMSRAARELGMDRAQMFRLLKRYEIGKSPATQGGTRSKSSDEPRSWQISGLARRET